MKRTVAFREIMENPIFDEKGYVHYVYKLTFTVDERFYYYGKHSTKNLKDNYGGRGALVIKYRKKWGNCFKKEIVSYWPSKDEALREEHRIIGNLWTSDPFCLNLCPGGENNGTIDNTGLTWIHLGDQQKLIKPEFLQLYEEQGWKKGTPDSVKLKSSISQRGRKFSLEHREALRQAKLGTTISSSVRKKMSLAHMGKKKSEEVRENMRKAQRDPTLNAHRIAVMQNLVWIKRGLECHKVPKEQLDQFLKEGWEKGRFFQRKSLSLESKKIEQEA